MKVSFAFKKKPDQTQGESKGSGTAASSSKPKAAPAFEAADDDDDDDQELIAKDAPTTSRSSSSRLTGPAKGKTTVRLTGDAPSIAGSSDSASAITNSAHSLPSASAKDSRQAVESALEVDSSIFDYDGVYDSLKANERLREAAKAAERSTREAKYIPAAMESTKERQKLLLRAQAKKLQRERDAEGGQYEGGEEFVTEAYREQMEELRKVEEAEEQEEKKGQKKRNGAGGPATFYKEILEQQEREHQAAVDASLQQGSENRPQGQDDANIPDEKQQLKDEGKHHLALAKEAQAKGLDAKLNDEGELVDQSSVLSSGLNVFGNKKKTQQPSSHASFRHDGDRGSSSSSSAFARNGAAEARRLREEVRQRSARQIEDQLLEREARREQELQQEEEEKKRRLMGRGEGETASRESKAEEARRRMEERRKKRKLEES